MTLTQLTDEERARLIAHPSYDGETGWYFCFIHGSDAGEVAKAIQYFLEREYEFHGQPFTLNGEVWQAMHLSASTSIRISERMNAERDDQLIQSETESLGQRILNWLRGV